MTLVTVISLLASMSFPGPTNLSFPGLTRESTYDYRLPGQDETMTD